MRPPDQIGRFSHICFRVSARRVIMFIRFSCDVYPMTIEEVRAEVTRIDEEIIHLIAQRQHLAGKIATIKQKERIPVHDNQRKNDVLAYVMRRAQDNHVDPEPVKTIFETLIAMNEKEQRATIEKSVPQQKRVR
jgi:chorismate mutase